MGSHPTEKSGPLAGLRIIEMAGLGPVPLAGYILGGMGAEVIRIERLNTARPFLALSEHCDIDRFGRAILRVDLKDRRGTALVRRMTEQSDVLLEGFRPGAMERLELGPERFKESHPGLIYGRMTGFGQSGPLSATAGHDLTYLAYSGVLHAIGERDGKPVPPLNLVADYGGGTMFLIMGVLAALFERTRSGFGQVIDAAMMDGASLLASPFYAFMAAGLWQDRRGQNLLDGGAPFYDTYLAADGKHVAVACLEPKFFAEFIEKCGLDSVRVETQYRVGTWPELRRKIGEVLARKTRDEWAALFENSDACVAPVLSLEEAMDHPHNRARNAHLKIGDFQFPAPAPRFSRTPAHPSGPARRSAEQLNRLLSRFGVDEPGIAELMENNIVAT